MNPQNTRGDKNVVSSSLKTFFSAIRDKVGKQNKKFIIEYIKAIMKQKEVSSKTYSPIWVYVALRQKVDSPVADQILLLYINKME